MVQCRQRLLLLVWIGELNSGDPCCVPIQFGQSFLQLRMVQQAEHLFHATIHGLGVAPAKMQQGDQHLVMRRAPRRLAPG